MNDFDNSGKSKIRWIIPFLLIFAGIVYADTYLNSRTGSIYLNTSNIGRVQITSGGNLVLLGLANVSIPGNLSIEGNLSVKGNDLFVDTTNDRVGIATKNPTDTLTIIGSAVTYGSLNATNINATAFLQGGFQVQLSRDFNLGNISNYTQYTRSSDFNLGNISNYTQYATQANIRTNITDYLGGQNASIILAGNLTTLDKLDLYIRVKDFNLGNISNNTLTKDNNASIALWNISIPDSATEIHLFPRFTNTTVQIGNFNQSLNYTDILTILGSVVTYGSFNATFINATNFLQGGQPIMLSRDFNLGNISNNTYPPTSHYTFNISSYLGGADVNASLIKAGNLTTLDTLNLYTRSRDFNLNNISNYTQYGTATNIRANISDFLGQQNGSLILTSNLTTLNTLDLYIRVKDFSTANVSNDTLRTANNASIALWNRTSTSTFLRFTNDIVGIGTPVPDNKLTIIGDDADSTRATPGLLHLNLTDNNNNTMVPLLTLDHLLVNPNNVTKSINGDANLGLGILMRAINNLSMVVNISLINATLVNANNGSEASALSFYTLNSTPGYPNKLLPRLILNGSDLWIAPLQGNVFIAPNGGNVGIGTAIPTGLQINSAVDSENARGVDNIRLGVNAGSPRVVLEDAGSTMWEMDNSAGSLRFFQPGTTRFTITSGGLVGIGNTAPVSGVGLYVQSNAAIGANYNVAAPNNGLIVEGNVGIGTTAPQNSLDVVGAVTVSKGLNASNLNVTGFSITDDSLVTLSNGSKKKIKDIKAGEKVLTLDESTGKLVPRKVNALLDHGVKPIYEMATEDGKSINTTAEHPYLVKLYSKEECDKYAGNVWNKEPDEFDSYCTRWVEAKDLNEGMEIAVPKDKYQNKFFDLRNSTNSAVVNTLINDCSLKCGSFDQTGHLPMAKDKAKYSVSSGSEMSLLASPRNGSYLDIGKGLIVLFNLLNNSSSSGEERPERNLILDLCSSTSLNKASGQCSLTDFEKIISFVTPMPIMPVNTTVASTTKSIYLNSGCNFLSFLYMPALTSLANRIASSSVNLDLETILLNSSKSSCSISRLIASSLATSDQFTHWNLSIFAFNSAGTVNDTFAIYASPLCLLNNSNSSSSFTLFSKALLNTSGQFMSLCLPNLSLSSFGNDMVTVGIVDNLLVLISLRDYVRILENVQIYKSFASDANSDITFEKIASIKELPPQHVYDLSIEGTRNFIANDIVAHNTYLATSSGNVGIGTTSPDSKLTVIGNANITSDLRVNGFVNFTNNTAFNQTMYLVNGRVGIGTTSPIRNLQLNANGDGMLLGTVGTGNSNVSIFFGQGTSGETYFRQYYDYGSSDINFDRSVDGGTNWQNVLNLDFNVGNVAVANGSLGVGIIQPLARLQISRPTDTPATAPSAINKSTSYLHLGGGEFNTNSYRIIGFGWVDSNSVYPPAFIGYKEININGNTLGDLIFGTRNVTSDIQPTQRLIISNSGTVGIGPNITTPSALLQLVESAPELRMNSTAGGYIGLKTNSVLNTDFDIQQNGTSRIYLNPSGNVGIGTTAPTDTLTVIGSAVTYGSLNATNINATTFLQGGLQVQLSKDFNLGNISNYTQYTTQANIRTNITDYLGGQNASIILAGNLTILDKLDLYIRVKDFSTLNISNNTLVKGDNASIALWNNTNGNTFLRFTGDKVGIGTPVPDNKLTIIGDDADSTRATPGLLHLNLTDNYNNTMVPMMTLDHLLVNPNNVTKDITGNSNLGLGILMRAINNLSMVVNVSLINATLVNANNGSEASVLSFYTLNSTPGYPNKLIPRLMLNGSNVFIAPNGGNVGIGTTSPNFKLDVLATGNYDSDTAGAFRITSAAATTKRIFMGYDATQDVGFIQAADTGTDWKNFAINAIGGKVGIGTVSPSTLLHVNGNITASSLTFGVDDTSEDVISAASDDLVFRWKRSDTGTHTIFFRGVNSEGTTEFMRISGAGHVGVNQTSPSSMLHVGSSTANIDSSVLRVQDGDGNCFFNPESTDQPWTCSSDERLKRNIRKSAPVLPYILGIPIKDFNVIASGDNKTGVVAQELMINYPELVTFDSSSGNYMATGISSWKIVKAIQEQQEQIEELRLEKMRITGVGNVGIGNTIPNNTLDISGNVNVSGRLSYGTLAANSPHFLETMGSPEPLCVKSSSGKYVGCMVNENFEFECRIDDRCSRKFLDARLAEEIEKLSKEATEDKADNAAAESAIANENAASNQITGNAINELGLETDLSNILEPSDNTTNAGIVFENNSDVGIVSALENGTFSGRQKSEGFFSASGENASISQINPAIQQQAEEDYDEIPEKIQRLSKIRHDIKSKSITVKQAIEQLKLEQLKDINLDEIESEEDAAYQAGKGKGAATVGDNASSVIQQAPQLDYITKVNGSVIIRLG